MALSLSKYLALSGICSRRKAVEIIEEGRVKVNAHVVTEPGQKVEECDQICLDGKRILVEKKVYVLLNKPRSTVTTVSDEAGRKTVMNLLDDRMIKQRIYPVGRLDYETTGVLLLTNDGELAQQLSHPRNKVKKVYQVRLNKPLEPEDFETIKKGTHLPDGFFKPDYIAYASFNDRSIVRVEIHSGKNRIVRRMFEYWGYLIKRLDRVSYAGLTAQDLQAGNWRFLNEREIARLKGE